jgi:aconitate hydratase
MGTRHPDSFAARDSLAVGGGTVEIFRLEALQERFDVARLPFSVKVLLENLLRTEDGTAVTAEAIEALAGWDPAGPATSRWRVSTQSPAA